MCACHWLLGVGDRHLENSQVSLTNGVVLGIDFGHAFGTATQYLPIPELIPFRLTPHILELMLPLKEIGTFRDVFISCLKSLRKNKRPLLATMNVFIQEPPVEWLKLSGITWYPIHKINQAKTKLEGISSRNIVIEDLKSNSIAKPEIIQECIKAVEIENSNSMGNLTVEQQVDDLIKHAVDPKILSRLYVGWLPFI
ncbi:hypothetical protein GWI33_007924 [Rhynchophorus ferrugineus]|uniref:Non-specific serine/threonine protein kinase n=1 Tax=Rhynchophorus ferrugineus TaxID=354439 RepID=A0A834MBJ9_RHYFE|nr:hypothetical protein GWI33_007924 [Rhynchophorus ferrugineus]